MIGALVSRIVTDRKLATAGKETPVIGGSERNISALRLRSMSLVTCEQRLFSETAETMTVKYEIDGGVGVVTLAKPPRSLMAKAPAGGVRRRHQRFPDVSMQTHPLLVVAASLGTDAVDGFLDAIRDSDTKLWSSPSDETGKEAIRLTFLNLISGFGPVLRTSDCPPAGPGADSPFCHDVPVGTRQAVTCKCSRHLRHSRAQVRSNGFGRPTPSLLTRQHD